MRMRTTITFSEGQPMISPQSWILTLAAWPVLAVEAEGGVAAVVVVDPLPPPDLMHRQDLKW